MIVSRVGKTKIIDCIYSGVHFGVYFAIFEENLFLVVNLVRCFMYEKKTLGQESNWLA